ncbi:PepSY-associated TM helix domain-containing protein [Pigmentiphaga litoralis]|uniref:Putative iron-regulated membrane protein n=1 Tax=Pigmentiphaga litoralis TaxID=516702 RepID=A0A7Y9ISV7_9BURK|nr:PepSY-associated TM helix domain-containing protein [Pigmentiphaga litoralis]NYE24063.1 putative iron-regulated membrane protein [Pigmentiphaga litoralis]NYE82323.1 putative iron-regulated membrane protein [Pigmentiphaga litoralis]
MAGVRQRYTVVHRWAGILFGALLFAIFWMGTLSVFDRELDRWMMPATRLAGVPGPVRMDPVVDAVASLVPADARQWRIDLPTPRTPAWRFTAQRPGEAPVLHLLDPATLDPLPDPGTLGASGFFFPFHYGLHLSWKEIGKWLVGAASMAMLVLLIAGIVIHRKVFREFFTFRPDKRLPRSTLDLHNVTGVLGLPFHFVIVLSGLVIFFNLYFPFAYQSAYQEGAKGKAQFQAQSYGRYTRPLAGLAAQGPLASVDAMAAQAESVWGGGVPYFVRVWNPGDANRYVELRRAYFGEVTMNIDQLYFDGATGTLLARFSAGPVMSVQRFLSGVHFIQFDHWPLRWLYFFLGLTGCVMIATGMVFWLASRSVGQKAGLEGIGPRVALATSIAGVTGLLIATLAYLAANRLLPAGASAFGWTRAELEVWAFFIVWLMALVHALRGGRAWGEQAGMIAALAVLCVVLNAATTDAYRLGGAVGPIAVWGVDGALLVTAAIATWAGWRLRRGWRDGDRRGPRAPQRVVPDRPAAPAARGDSA